MLIEYIRDRWAYLLAVLRQPGQPAFPVPYLPNGFCVNHIAATGIAVIDNFCTAEEARYLIEAATPQLRQSTVIAGDRFNTAQESEIRRSSTAKLMDRDQSDPKVLPLLYRGAMLTGLSHANVDTVYVTRYREGDYYKAHADFTKRRNPKMDRWYTLLVYLNDLDANAGGATCFPRLNVSVSPKLGRCICWTNTNPDGSYHPETLHAALPVVGEGAEKWVVQLWFRRYGRMGGLPAAEALQVRPGVPLKPGQQLPDGVGLRRDEDV